jgi:phasin
VNESEVKAELNGTKAFGMSMFVFPKVALPGVFAELAEQGVARTQEGCNKLKTTSEEIAEALRETYSDGAKSATDYGLKLIDFSNANTVLAIDFFTRFMRSKSMTDVLTLSATQAHKTFDTVSAQTKDLWELAQKLATETAEPIRKRTAKVFQKAG